MLETTEEKTVFSLYVVMFIMFKKKKKDINTNIAAILCVERTIC